MEEEWYYGKYNSNLESELETRMILGMLDMEQDPFTRYLTSLGTLADSFEGLGVLVEIYGEYFIIDEVSSEHASIDGLKVGDILTKVNGTDIKNITLTELNKLITQTNTVNFTLIREGQTMDVVSSIQKYEPITIFTKEYPNASYVKITEFNLDTASSLESYFKTLSTENSNLILDLRGNPGGYISAVQEVLDLFVGANKVVMTTINKKGVHNVVKTVNGSFYVFDKIVVMIDENSASGAEALAAALNYHLDDIVTLYGNKTYGKGSAQKTYYFSDGTYFHYTYALWYTPAGETINKVGVSPEVYDANLGISSLSFSGVELKKYDYGNNVLYVQALLNSLGYDVTLHAFVDDKMVEAIKQYQQDYNLQQTGNVDNSTIRHMLKLIYDDKQIQLQNQLDAVLGSL